MPTWIIIAGVVVVLLAIVIVVAVVKARNKNRDVAHIEQSSSVNAHDRYVADEDAELERKLRKARDNTRDLKRKGAVLNKQRKQDHENIDNSDDWDSLMDNARDIEGRRK